MRWFTLLTLVLLVAPSLAAEPNPPVHYRTGVRLVTVDITAEDTRGRPVTDLNLQEIQITEDGVPVEILEFHRPMKRTEPAKPGESTPDPLSLTVVILDTLGASRNALHQAPDALGRFLREGNLPAETQIVACLLDQRIHLLGRLDPARQELPRLVEQLRPGHSEGKLVLRRPAALKALPAGPLAELEGFRPHGANRGTTLLHAFTQVARTLTPLEGRKAILWISAGRIFDRSFQQLSWRRVRRWKQAAGDARATLHAVDLEGLRAPTCELGLFMKLEWKRKSFLWQLAQISGGTLYESSNDRAAAVQQAMEGARSVYQAVYRSPNGSGREGFRTIEARCTRPAVRLRARSGYQVEEGETGSGTP